MGTKTLNNLFLAGIMDMYDAEHRITKAVPKLAKAATCPKLKEALLNRLEETKGQIENLTQVFNIIGEKPKAKKCEATVGLLKDGDFDLHSFTRFSFTSTFASEPLDALKSGESPFALVATQERIAAASWYGVSLSAAVSQVGKRIAY